MNLDPVKFTVSAGAEVVFDVARTAHVFGIGSAARKFVEDHAVWLGQHVGEHVEPAAVGHAVNDFAHAALSAVFDHGFKRRDHRFPAIKPEPLGPDIFAAEEFLILLTAHYGLQDRLLAFGGEVDRFVAAFDPFLNEAAFLDIGDVHVFKADLAAVIALQDVDQFAQGRPFKAKRTAQVDLAVQRSAGKTVVGRVQIGRQVLVAKPKRIKVSAQVSAHAVGADQHHRPDRIRRGFLNRARIHWRASFGRRSLDRRLHLRGIKRLGQIVRSTAPIRLAPAGAGLRIVGEEFVAFIAHRRQPFPLHVSGARALPGRKTQMPEVWLPPA